MPDPPWTIELYEEPDGRCPVAAWLDSLPRDKRSAMITAIEELLAYVGPNVCSTEYGKALGQGLYELRVRHSASELRAHFGYNASANGNSSAPPPSRCTSIHLRLFFHPHGRRLILLLGGYDKGVRPAPRHQSRQIQLARRRLNDFKRRAGR